MALRGSRRIEGSDAIVLAIRDVHRRRVRGLVRGLRLAAEHLLDRTLPKVPIDTQELYDSGKVEAQGRGKNIDYAVTFTAEHAIYVHEDLTANHPNGGSAKFLESTFRQEQPAMNAIIRAEVRKG